MTKIKVQQEWSDSDIKDFLSDFVGVIDEDGVSRKGSEVYLEKLEDEWDETSAYHFSWGYEQALKDILGNTK